tara:strand:- start:270 stop:1043 length:774 start_codon:yes stop_codon:yes gene_type:complete
MFNKSKVSDHTKAIKALEAEIGKMSKLKGSFVIAEPSSQEEIPNQAAIDALQHTIDVLGVILDRISREKDVKMATLSNVMDEEKECTDSLTQLTNKMNETDALIDLEKASWSSALGQSNRAKELVEQRGSLGQQFSELSGRLMQIREFMDSMRESLLELEKESISVQNDIKEVEGNLENVRRGECGEVSSKKVSEASEKQALQSLAKQSTNASENEGPELSSSTCVEKADISGTFLIGSYCSRAICCAKLGLRNSRE